MFARVLFIRQEHLYNFFFELYRLFVIKDLENEQTYEFAAWKIHWFLLLFELTRDIDERKYST